MDKKQAHYLATLAARETFKKTFKKLAQTKNFDENGEIIVEEIKPNVYYDPSKKDRGGETLIGGENETNRPDYKKEKLDLGLADDKDDDKKCDKCGCTCKGKKEASAPKSALMRVASAYAKTLK